MKFQIINYIVTSEFGTKITLVFLITQTRRRYTTRTPAQTRTFTFKDNWFLTSKDDKVAMFTPITEEDKEGQNLILTVAFKNGRYWLYQSRDFTYLDAVENPADQAWIVLKEMNPSLLKEKLHK